MKRAMDEGHTHYGEFAHIRELREAVADKYGGLEVDVDPDRVLVTPGSTMGIYMVLRGLVGPGNGLVTFDPCFFGYLETMKHVGCVPVPVPRYVDEDWAFHREDLEAAVTSETKGILICSPDNPTGAVLGRRELEDVAEVAVERDLMVVSDDIYDAITYDGEEFSSIAALPGMAERTVILNGLSKTYAMTGWRVGYVIAPTDELAKRFMEIQMSTFLVLNAAVQRAALAALTGPQDCVAEMVAGYAERREYVLDFWDGVPGAKLTRPKGAFYAFPDISSYGLSSAEMAKYLREEADVVVTRGSLFGARGEGHIRQAYAQTMEDIVEGLDRIGEALAKL
jgi:aminotransferase